MVFRQQVGHLLIELSEVILDHAQLFERELQQPSVDRMQRRTRLECIAQLLRCGAQARGRERREGSGIGLAICERLQHAAGAVRGPVRAGERVHAGRDRRRDPERRRNLVRLDKRPQLRSAPSGDRLRRRSAYAARLELTSANATSNVRTARKLRLVTLTTDLLRPFRLRQNWRWSPIAGEVAIDRFCLLFSTEEEEPRSWNCDTCGISSPLPSHCTSGGPPPGSESRSRP